MGSVSALYLFMFMRFLTLFLISSFYLLQLANSSSSSSSSSSMLQQHQHPLLCHDGERSALLHFKRSFLIDCAFSSADPFAYPKVATWGSFHGGDGEGEGEGEGSECCSWDGVECDRETGHVIGLHLPSSCLNGSINSSSTLFHLLHLRTLNLSDNHFNHSEIPSAVGQLSRLTTLDLSYSVFSGQIPSELLALSKLVFLDLSGNTDLLGNPLLKLQKPGLKDLVQNLTHLKALHLSQVDISSTIPHELGNLSSLTYLRLRGCGLHGEFPEDIFRMPSLQVLSVRYNPNLIGSLPEFQEGSPLQNLYLASTSFSGELPTAIGRLSSLTVLDIHSCSFTGIVPSSLGHLPQLSYLDLSDNSFSGPIPSSFANLTLLTYLDLSDNNFQTGSTLAWLGQQTKLILLDLDQTNLRGEIPCGSLVNMSQLSVLLLAENHLSGQIPSCLMNLTRLIQVDLTDNELEGSIPSSLFELVNLEYLDLAANQLNGTVELHMFSKLKSLTELQLSLNKLSLISHNSSSTNATFPKFSHLGLSDCNLTEFPDFLRSQDELEILILSRNKIHGLIPKWMWNISKETLTYLDLSDNFLTGFEQPPIVLPWSRLTKLALHSNKLQGPLPIPPPSTVQYSIAQNKLRGPIPPFVCNMTSLMVLDLSSNNLSGEVPQCLANFSESLVVIDLGSNNFNGPIPEICTGPNNLEVIDLGENQFHGQLPKSLSNCMMLEDLVLGNNQIDDIFPFWLGAQPRLKVLILRSNRFHGAIQRSSVPNMTTFNGFPNLHIIDLSDNEFSGDLPSEYFQNWDAMTRTNVSNRPLRYMHANSTYKEPGYTMTIPFVYSMTITNKGMQRLFYRGIPDTLMAIDLSGNKFRGQIPASIGRLQGLHMLNLARNNLTGPILSSLGNLTQLESLDLSQNMLSGGIPWQLTSLTFLEFFNVSHNHLTGPIPQGGQLTTRSNDSFLGNPGLCGLPLSRACEGPPPPLAPKSSSSEQDQGSTKLDWTIVLMGYGGGVVIGVSIGYCFTIWKHDWFVKTFGRKSWRYSKWVRTERMGLRS